MDGIKINVFNKTAKMLIYWAEVLKFYFILSSNYLTMLCIG